MIDYPKALTERQIGRPDEGWIGDAKPPSDPIRLSDPNPAWPAWFAREAARINGALGQTARRVEHVGSTSVPGLPAKPIIDIDVWVSDSDREDEYVPALNEIGYTLVLREPWWNGHRMLIPAHIETCSTRVNLHVFPVNAPEPLRHLLFRDWLRIHDDDRDLYAAAKRRLADATADDPGRYNLAKNEVIDDIYTRIFALPPTAHPAWQSLKR